MSGEQILIERLLGALNILNGAESSQNDRRQAQEFIEKFKTEAMVHQFVIEFSRFLFQPQQTIHVRHFALHLLEIVIKSDWNRMDLQRKQNIIQFVLFELFAKSTKNMLEELELIKEKLVVILLELVKREWPQNWPNLFEQLNTIAQQGPSQLELVVMFLGALPSANQDTNFTQRRCKDLFNAINNTAQFVFDVLCNFLDNESKLLSQIIQSESFTAVGANNTSPSHQNPNNANNNGNSNQQQKGIHFKMLQRIMSTIAPYVDLIPIIAPFQRKLPETLCQLMMVDEIRMASCECLLAILSRKAVRGELESEPYVVLFGYIDNFVKLIQATPDLVKFNDLHRYLVQILCSIGLFHCGTGGLHQTKKALPPTYNTYLELMAAYLSHPSFITSQYTTRFWVHFLQNHALKQKLGERQLSLHLLTIIFNKVQLLVSPNLWKSNATDSLYIRFLRSDFDSEQEFRDFVASFKLNMKEMVRFIARDEAQLCLTTIERSLLQFLNDANDSTKDSNLTLSSLQTTVFLLDGTLQGLVQYYQPIPYQNFQEKQQQQQQIQQQTPTSPILNANGEIERPVEAPVKEAVEKLLQTILSFNPQVHNSITVRATTHLLAGLHAFSGCLKLFISPLVQEAVIGRLLSYAAFVSPPGTLIETLPVEVIQLRKKSVHALVSLAKSEANLFSPFLARLASDLDIMFSKNLLLNAERTSLFEFLALIVNALPKDSAYIQSQYLGSIIGRLEKDFFEMFQRYCENQQRFLQLFVSDTTFADLRRFTQVLMSMNAVWNRVTFSKPPLAHMIRMIPYLCNLVRLFHSLWETNVRLQVLSALPIVESIYRPTDTQKSVILNEQNKRKQQQNEEKSEMNAQKNGGNNGVGNKSQFEAEQHSPEKTVAASANNFRDSLYDLFALYFSQPETYAAMNGGDIQIALRDSLFSGVEHMETRHLAIFVRTFVKGILSSCPVAVMSGVVCPFLTPFIGHVYGLIRNFWQSWASNSNSPLTNNNNTSLSSNNNKQSNDKSNREKSEIVEESFWRSLTREFSHFLYVIIVGAQDSSSANTNHSSHHHNNGNNNNNNNNNANTISFSDLAKTLLIDSTNGSEIAQQFLSSCLHGLVMLMSVPDSLSQRRAIQGINAIISPLIQTKNERFMPTIGDFLYSCCLMMQPQFSEVSADCLVVIHTILIGLAQLNLHQLPQMVFLSLPGMTLDRWQRLNQALFSITPTQQQQQQQNNSTNNNNNNRSSTQQKGNPISGAAFVEREQKNVLRQFFDGLYGEQTTPTFPKIEELATKITSFKQPKQSGWSWHNETDSLGLDSLLK